MKICTTCKQEKAETEYYLNKGNKGKLQSQCKKCIIKKTAIYHNTEKGKLISSLAKKKYAQKPENKEKARLRMVKYRESNREHYRKLSREYGKKPHVKRMQINCALKRKYGITIDDKEQMWLNQNKKCKICESLLVFEDSMVDHNHRTGEVRGILCNACNACIGYAKENTQILSNAINYLTQY